MVACRAHDGPVPRKGSPVPTQAVSFVVRLTQLQGASSAAWRGLITHVQTGAERRFTDFATAVAFMQQYLEPPNAAGSSTEDYRRDAETP